MHRWQHYIDRAEEISELIRSTGARLTGILLSGRFQERGPEEVRALLMMGDEGVQKVLFTLISAHVVRGDLQMARDVALEAHAAYPMNNELTKILIDVHMLVQDHHAALATLDAMEDRVGYSTRMRLDRAWCYLAMNRPDECHAILEEAWRDDEVELEDHEQRAKCLRELDRAQEALDHIEGLQARGIDSINLRRERIYSLLKIGDRDRAGELLEDLLVTGGPQAVLYYALGNAYEDAGELTKAKAIYLRGFEQAPDNDGVCLFLALLPDDLFDGTEALPVQYMMRATHVGGLANAMLPVLFIKALVRHRLPMQLIDLLVDSNDGVRLIAEPEQAELLRLGRPFERLFTSWSAKQDPELVVAEAVLRYHLGDVGGCFRLIDERIMVQEQAPSYLVRYYYLLAGAMLLEDMDALARVNAELVQRGSLAHEPDDMDAYYGALILRCAGLVTEAEALLHRALERSPQSIPCHMLHCRFALATSSAGDDAPLQALVAELAKESSYYREPKAVDLPLAGMHPRPAGIAQSVQREGTGSALATLMPVFHFLEQFEVLSSVETYIRPYRTTVPGVDPFTSSERPIFTLCRVLEPDPITGLLDEKAGDAQAGVRSLAEILALGQIEGELGKWVDGYVSMGLDRCIAELGLEVHERVRLAMSDPKAVRPSLVVDKASRAFLVAGALLKDHPDRLEDVLALQHYCQYALRCWAQEIPAEVVSEAESQITDQLLKAIGQMDVAAEALEYAIFTFNPGLWVCAKAVGKATRWVYTTYIDHGFVPFGRYQEWIASRKKEASGSLDLRRVSTSQTFAAVCPRSRP